MNSKGGEVVLGKNAPTKVLGKGRVYLDVKNTKEANVLLVEGLKKNILSVGQITN